MSALRKLRDRGRRVVEDLDGHYSLRPDVPETPCSRFRPKVNKRLSVEAWRAAFNQRGQVQLEKVLPRIQKGGVDPSIRPEVWEFLLGCFSPDSDAAERTTIRMSRRQEYAKLKEECRALDSAVGSGQVVTMPRIQEDDQRYIHMRREESMSSDYVDEDVKRWRIILHQIGLDVVRTDRMLQVYERQENLARLWDILAVYAWHDGEVGYCQGMSDLCSPMVVLYPDEADAFWCFERLMSRVRDNFKCTEKTVGVQKQLENLATVMRVLDPKLHRHLEVIGGGGYIFSFRMVMVLFRREFSFADTLYLWEMMWSSEFIPSRSQKDWKPRKIYNCSGQFGRQNMKLGSSKSTAGSAPLTVFCMAAIFEMNRPRLLNNTQGLDDVVKLLNDITGMVDAKDACKKAVKLHRNFLIKGETVRKPIKKYTLDALITNLSGAAVNRHQQRIQN